MSTQHVALLSLPPPSPSAPGQRGGGAGLAPCSLLENAEAQRLSALPGSQRGRTGDPHSGSDPNPLPLGATMAMGVGVQVAGCRTGKFALKGRSQVLGAGERRGGAALQRKPERGGACHVGVRDPHVRMGEPQAGQPRASEPNRRPTRSRTQALHGELGALARSPPPRAPSDVVPRSVGSGGRDGQSTVRPDSLRVSKPGSRRGGWEGQSHTGSAQPLTAGTLCLEKRH